MKPVKLWAIMKRNGRLLCEYHGKVPFLFQTRYSARDSLRFRIEKDSRPVRVEIRVVE